MSVIYCPDDQLCIGLGVRVAPDPSRPTLNRSECDGQPARYVLGTQSFAHQSDKRHANIDADPSGFSRRLAARNQTLLVAILAPAWDAVELSRIARPDATPAANAVAAGVVDL